METRTLKRWIGRVPFVGPSLRSAYRRARWEIEFPRVTGQLEAAPCPAGRRIALALAALRDDRIEAENPTLVAIEKERRSLLACHEPLVDGSLGEASPFDRDTRVSDACRVSKSPRPARFLYHLVKAFAPQRCIELGTNVGLSSAYQAAALADAEAGGRLVTLEGSPYRLRIAREVHGRLGLGEVDHRQGAFADTLDDAIEAFGPFDYAFIDGNHHLEPTLDYFERIWRHATDEALFVFDDIRWSEGMERAWSQLRRDPRVALSVDLESVGLCVVKREAAVDPCVLPPVRFAFG